MKKRRKLYINPHAPSGGWAIIGAGNKKPNRVVQTLSEAILVAADIAPKLYDNIVLHPAANTSRVNALLGRCNSRGEKIQ